MLNRLTSSPTIPALLFSALFSLTTLAETTTTTTTSPPSRLECLLDNFSDIALDQHIRPSARLSPESQEALVDKLGIHKCGADGPKAETNLIAALLRRDVKRLKDLVEGKIASPPGWDDLSSPGVSERLVKIFKKLCWIPTTSDIIGKKEKSVVEASSWLCAMPTTTKTTKTKTKTPQHPDAWFKNRFFGLLDIWQSEMKSMAGKGTRPPFRDETWSQIQKNAIKAGVVDDALTGYVDETLAGHVDEAFDRLGEEGGKEEEEGSRDEQKRDIVRPYIRSVGDAAANYYRLRIALLFASAPEPSFRPASDVYLNAMVLLDDLQRVAALSLRKTSFMPDLAWSPYETFAGKLEKALEFYYYTPIGKGNVEMGPERARAFAKRYGKGTVLGKLFETHERMARIVMKELDQD